MQSADAQRKPLPLLQTPFQEAQAEFSPDAKWVAYLSDESGRYEIYVRPFNASGPSGTPSLGEGKWQVSKDGAQGVAWPESGKELILLGRDGTVYTVEVSTTPSFHAGAAQPLFRIPAATSQLTVTRDGKKFLLAVAIEPDKPEPITVLLNWDTALRKSGQ
jgi:hypothetical protein